jgi:hypothetical protein
MGAGCFALWPPRDLMARRGEIHDESSAAAI